MKDIHINNPIPDSEWECPKCGEKEEFYIDEIYDCGNAECEKEHDQDIVRCYKCDTAWTLKTIINKWKKKKNMILCPHCKGTGYIPKE
jgi:hypothetical protein